MAKFPAARASAAVQQACMAQVCPDIRTPRARASSVARWFIAAALSAGFGIALAQTPDAVTPSAVLEQRQFPALEQRLKAIHADAEAGRVNQDNANFQMHSILHASVLTAPVLQDLSAYVQGRDNAYALSLFMGMFYRRYAGELRGNKLGHQTSATQQAEFAAYLHKAEKALRAAVLLDKRPYLAYAELIPVDMGLGNAELAADYEQALALSPSSFIARDRYMDALSPKWGGSLDKLDEFVARVRAEPIPEALKKRVASQALALEAQQYDFEAQRQRAARTYELAFDTYPYAVNLSPLRQAVRVSKLERAYAEAVRLCGKGLDIAPKDVALLNQRAYLYETQLDQPALAAKDYEAASDRNDLLATRRLGLLYLRGKGVARNPELAQRLLTKAATGGDKSAAAVLWSISQQRSGSPASSIPKPPASPEPDETL